MGLRLEVSFLCSPYHLVHLFTARTSNLARCFDDDGPYDAETCISTWRAECFEHFKFGM